MDQKGKLAAFLGIFYLFVQTTKIESSSVAIKYHSGVDLRSSFSCSVTNSEYLGYKPYHVFFELICRDGWTMVNGKCFYFTDDVTRNISASTEYCESMGPHSRLFQPQSPEDVMQIETSVHAEYTTPGEGDKILIHMGIRHVVDGSDSRNWYWPSVKQPIQAPWWCPNQPDESLEQSELVLNAQQNPVCFHDVGEDCKAYFICNQDITSFCPETYKLHQNRCFGLGESELNFTAAEAECNKLLGGHLAAFRNEDELNFLKQLESNARPVWIGLTRSGDGSTWMFKDGTSLPVGSGNIIDSSGDCVEINNNGNMQSTQCWKAERYVCMAKALGKVQLFNETWRDEYEDLFDMNKETCLDSKMTLLQVNRPHLDLIIPQVETQANITVYFNQTLNCQQREIVYLWKEHSIQTCTTQRYLKSCDLMTTGSDVTSCSYRCPCEDNQCRVVVDDEEQFKEQPTNICEITYELEE